MFLSREKRERGGGSCVPEPLACEASLGDKIKSKAEGSFHIRGWKKHRNSIKSTKAK